MEKALEVAKALYNMYKRDYEEEMDEMKMHKLMYFSQRESLMFFDRELFSSPFFGWKFGPVSKVVRSAYKQKEDFLTNVEGKVSLETSELLESVLKRYGGVSPWELSTLSHQEFSWQKSRQGMKEYVNGNVKLDLEMMKLDAKRELLKREN